jgi:hypothetical protein
MTFWQAAPWLLLALSGSLAIAAAWPPFHARRMMVAGITFLAGTLVLAAGNLTTINLSTRVAVVAECPVYQSDAFAPAIAEARQSLPLFSDLHVTVLGLSPNTPCPEAPGGLKAVRLLGAPTLNAAMTAVDRELSSESIITSWRARRIILFGEPGGPISQGQPIADEDRDRFLAILEAHRADIEYRQFGVDPIRNMKLSAPLWRLTDPTVSLGVQLELSDARIREAKKVVVELSDQTLDSTCKIQTSKFTPTFDRNELKNGTVGLDEELVEWPAPNRLVLRVRFGGGLVDSARLGQCGSGWWSLIKAKATVTLEDNTSIVFSHSIMQGRAEQTALTLVTPTPSTTQDRRAAIGWETNGPQFMSNGAAGPGLSEILAELYDSMIGRSDNVRNKWPLAVLWRTIENGCWFRGITQFQDAAGQEKFKACLRTTKRLAVITPTADDIAALEGAFGISQRVNAGKLHTLVAAPDYATAGAVSASQWAAIDSAPVKVTTTPLLFFSPSRNALLTRGLDAARLPQKAIFDALVATPFIGYAEPPSTCDVARPVTAPRDRAVLGWFWDVSPVVPVQPRGSTFSTNPNMPQIRSRGVLKHSPPASELVPGAYSNDATDRFGTANRFEENLLCNHPVKRLVDTIMELKRSGLLVPGESSMPRASIMILDVAQKVPPIAKIADVPLACQAADPTLYQEDRMRGTIAEFLGAGGKVIVQPVFPALPFDETLIDDAVTAIGGTPGLDLEVVMNDASAPRPAGTIAVLPVKNLVSDKPQVIADQMLREMFGAWAAEERVQETFAFRADDGALTDRRDTCAYDDVATTTHCAFSPTTGSGQPMATVLNRVHSTPESYRGFIVSDDVLVSGNIKTGDGTLLRTSRPIGLGWSHFLGFSPLSRSDFGHASRSKPATALLKNALCYLYSSGTETQLDRTKADSVAAPIAYGGITMLDRFARAPQDLIGEPRVDSIVMDEASGTGGFTLVLYAAIDDDTSWNWRLRLADVTGAPFPNGDPASLIFKSYDPRTGEARIRVEPRTNFTGGITISFIDLPDGERSGDITLPVELKIQAPQFSFAESLDGLALARSAPSRLTLDSSAAMVFALAACALAMFSPLARSWVAPMEAIRARLRRSVPVAWLPRRAAPLFSLQAALAEFGMHPGRPVAARNAGLPAGLRSWRSGDAGRSITTASMYPLVGQNSALPATRPRVRLKTSFEAASALIMIEGTGALLSPPPSRSAGKADFAAALTAFIAGAVSLAYGRAEVARVGLVDRLTQDADELLGPVRAALEERPSFISPAEELQSAGTGSQLVYYICDGLSLNPTLLGQMADAIAVDGGTLRVAAIVSQDDENAAMLRRDPRTGVFEDDSETHKSSLIAARDRRISTARADLDRRGALLVTFDSHMGTQEVLQQVNETGLLK